MYFPSWKHWFLSSLRLLIVLLVILICIGLLTGGFSSFSYVVFVFIPSSTVIFFLGMAVLHWIGRAKVTKEGVSVSGGIHLKENIDTLHFRKFSFFRVPGLYVSRTAISLINSDKVINLSGVTSLKDAECIAKILNIDLVIDAE